MHEVKGNILSTETMKQADAICFTSNGIRKNNGCLVMGAGVAKAFRDRFLHIDRAAGVAVENAGNRCQKVLELQTLAIIAFPTKHHWRDPSTVKLIKQSAEQLKELADQHEWNKVYLPRPGCANGGLAWKDVEPILQGVLDDRFYCITF